jgi:hypothetical protein
LKLFTKEPAEPVEKPSTPGKRKSSGTKRDKDIASREVKHHFTFKNYRFYYGFSTGSAGSLVNNFNKICQQYNLLSW